ncbi:type VII secretion protein EccE [Mycobacterium shinjukuense]|uniref:Type VII secretion protein EccE n=1 Tax=Mycobacterium shinjukuense TaxID=398694 RepID=A0A7I7MSS2_9MYCO|nr:type VII secretion protein EccE [Mycobacterium shinjukuense]MCV6986223.1 type VII secretion protein EccE [Mycobacterium shinjukuense]ORB72258.1 type VII secretion protein EccE [Mycobacterium shinjukuense]BBX75281.1 type VII secretion protein EccE [Mycobacterium shinjukuense]
MSRNRAIPWPGSGRITLASLAVVPAIMAYPWRSPRDYWLLGIAVIVVIALFGWWRGLHFTTILRRRLAMIRRGRGPQPGSVTRTTALLRMGSSAPDSLPLPLIAGYLNRYGIRADSIRITRRDSATGERQTWIGLTVDATDNLAALRARSARLPLPETAEVAARRLADHLREIGWDASTVDPAELPRVLADDSPESRETWRGLRHSDSDHVAAYQVRVDEALPETLDAIRSYPARETWTALEIAGAAGTRYTIAAGCALRTDTQPGNAAPLAGLTPQYGRHRTALLALDPLSTRRLDGHTEVPADLLTRLQTAVSRA